MKTAINTLLDLLSVAALFFIAAGRFAWLAITSPRRLTAWIRSDFGDEID
jgi:hypothetical protein